MRKRVVYRNSHSDQGIESGHERAKIDKEKVNKVEEKETYTISRCKCGLKNPAKWGKHNPNYNKNSLKNY